ncbi:MAG: hypothetical protein IVW57_03690 [Ktedonobacterales bacterium]|nr:hypothetical protein [Ktedonobacterales bacterium]
MPLLPFGYSREEPHSTNPLIPTPVVFEAVRPPRWEYHLVTVDMREQAPLDAAQLDALGAEGWLLISILRDQPTGPAARILYHFVRAAN